MKFLGFFALVLVVAGSSFARIIYSVGNESNDVPSSGDELSVPGLEKPNVNNNGIRNLDAEEAPKNTSENSTINNSRKNENDSSDNDDSAITLSAEEKSGGVEENSIFEVVAPNIPTMNAFAEITTENSYETGSKNFTIKISDQNEDLQRWSYSSSLDFNYELEKSERLNSNNSNSQDFLPEDIASQNVSLNVTKVDQEDSYPIQNENSTAQLDSFSNSNVTLKEELNNSMENTVRLQGTRPRINGTSKKSLCKSQQNISSQEFDDIVSAMGSTVLGDSFNVSHLTDIPQNVPGDGQDFEYKLTVEIFNYMNRSIASFQVLDEHSASYFTPPELIHPNTKEVFTFYEPSCCFPLAAFSLEIMGTEKRLVAYGESSYFKAIGLAFLPEGISLQQYFSNKSKFGEYLLMWQTEKVRSINVGKDNFHARATISGAFKCIVNIEIIEVPKC